ncbi:putative transcriptional regulator YheO [Spinactinospora alkalitolerans]|uniref:Putative transcriptional regulator YheO n=1 Tax=Spinactinospora alkalitolerans TaxID=687207 RepID=A0A852U2X1_9ACTN|nr:PAS domain-containing protein [Spinactinospora alkalitolerans]NYE50501.1 putative transcriptional regulator YheO [Spinactinospora alkalitolerans]
MDSTHTPRARPVSGDIELTESEQAQAGAMLDVLAQVVDPLAAALGPGCEVVLHDLTRLPDSVHRIAGGVTGRGPGAPATDLLIQHVRAGAPDHLIGYSTQLPDGREGRSSTIVVRLPGGAPVAALCLNVDVTDLRRAHELIGGLLVPGTPNAVPAPPAEDGPKESFPRSVEELTSALVREAVAAQGIPVELMKKRHKLQIVAQLQEWGVFLVKDAVEIIAEAISVSRFTVYNYLNELAERGTGRRAEDDTR